jgi:LPXTG-motif cell wall-anchored protein
MIQILAYIVITVFVLCIPTDTFATSIIQNNHSNVINSVVNDVSTGQNTSSNNNGNTTIKTRDAKSTVTIDNKLNLNQAQVICDCASSAPQPGPFVPPPSVQPASQPPTVQTSSDKRDPPSTTVNDPAGSTGSPSDPSDLPKIIPQGAVMSVSVLPATGPSINMWFSLIGSLLMMILGIYLIKFSWKEGSFKSLLKFRGKGGYIDVATHSLSWHIKNIAFGFYYTTPSSNST